MNSQSENGQDSPTSAAAWKKDRYHELTVPSGNVALVRKVNIDVFLRAGLIPNSLRKIIREMLSSGKAPDAKEMALDSEQQLDDMFTLFDSVALQCVVQPELSIPPSSDEERDPNKLYVDEVDLNDKAFIFQWAVGGTSDLEKFRQEQTARVEAVHGRQNLESSAEQPS